MNKKGQVQILFVFMLGVVFFFLGIGIAPALNDTINEAKGTHYGGYYYDETEGNWYINTSAEISCDSASISGQDKAVCTSLDAIKPFWIGLIFGLGAMVLGGIAIR